MDLHLDFETRSTVDLKMTGVYVYARDPSTKVLCAAYSVDGGPVQVWPTAAGIKMPRDLKGALTRDDCLVHAWNAQFERLITKHVLKIDIPLERWRCTAALARARGLPGKLEHALAYLDEAPSLAAKRRGSMIMLKWCKPLPAGGWAADPNEFMELLRYCMDDVRSEHLIEDRLYPLRPLELLEYQQTERVNDAGLPVDRPLAIAAATYGVEEKAELNGLLADLTDREITSTSQHARVKGWLKARLPAEVFAEFFIKSVPKKKADGEMHMVTKESTDKSARADFLASEAAKDCDPEIVEMIEIVDDAGKASVAKYARIAARAKDNGRAEGAYICYGAIQTKRFSSTGVQSHNFPRKGPPDVQAAIDAVLEHRVEGQVMHVLASLLRPTVMAAAARRLVWGDWSSVEARGMPWLANAQAKLDLYRKGLDVYRVNAQDIFGTPYDDVPDNERQIGKVSELSLQFGGARGALRAMARGYGIALENDKADRIVTGWRRANRWAMEFSQSLYEAFMRTVLGEDTSVGPVHYRQIQNLLPDTVSIACDLPGGTTLYYHGIKGTIALRHTMGSLKVKVAPDLEPQHGVINTWDTAVSFVKSMPGGYRTERIWHGLLAENVTQALCAALLRDCLLRVEAALRKLDAFIAGHTHDEIILDSSERHAAKAETILRREMVRVPKWLSGFPLGCEVKTGPRYVK